MKTTGLLLFGAVVLLVIWVGSALGLIRRVPRPLLLLADALFIFAAVRVGMSIAIIVFDSSPISYLIPICLGILALWFRPGRNLRP